MPRILFVDDEANFGTVLRDYLEMNGYEVRLCQNGEQGLRAFEAGGFDLCILDVMMPRMDGFTLAKHIRRHNQHIPILFLTARAMQEDVHQGFSLGGDDYLTKPFDSQELLYRIQALLRRAAQQQAGAPASQQQHFHIGQVEFDYQLHSIRLGSRKLRLSPKEAELLRLLCLHQNDLLPREKALRLLWGDANYFNARSMDVFISKLRKRLKADPAIRIENVHGKGFRLVVEDAGRRCH